MSFTYTSGIPADAHDPSVDAGTMRTNTNSIASIVNVDLYGFGTGTDGTHKQVTFSGNNVPVVLPTSPPVVFTNTVAGLPQLFYYSGTAAQGSNQYYFGSGYVQQGSTFLFGGMIIKWGLSVSSADVTYTVAFPNNTHVVTTTARSNGLQNNVTGNALPTGFTTSGSTTFFWIAIGY